MAQANTMGPNVVRAWFDTVLNPLIRGLRTEASALAEGDLTWRYQVRRLVSIVPVREHLIADAWENLDQMLSIHPGCKPALDQHDEQVQILLDAAVRLESALLKSPVFRQSLREVLNTLGGDPGQYFGACPAEEYASLLAEYTINQIRRLPGYYSTAPLWNSHGERFLSMRERDEVKIQSQAAEAAAGDLLRSIHDLLVCLTDLRNRLSLDLDVPIASV